MRASEKTPANIPEKHQKMGPSLDPVEQATPDGGEPFQGGGRHADLPFDYRQRPAADADYNANLARNARQDREAIGQMHGKDDGTPWVGKGRNAR
jgi:hypothetical protein